MDPINQKIFRALGVYSKYKEVLLFYNVSLNDSLLLKADKSTNGVDFKRQLENIEIKTNADVNENIDKLKDFYISQIEGKYFSTYRLLGEKQQSLYLAQSPDLSSWNKIGKIARVREPGILVPDYRFDGKYVVIFGKNALKLALSDDLKHWNVLKEPILLPRNDFFDSSGFKVAATFLIDKGILLIYYAYETKAKTPNYTVGAAILDKHNPKKVIWRSYEPIWEQDEHFKNKLITPLGVADLDGKIVFFWATEKEVYAISYLSFKKTLFDYNIDKPRTSLTKAQENPILEPIPERSWESKATFNPAAIKENGKIHLIYRAVGDSDTSVIGYATTTDGINIEERSTFPIYAPKEPFECPPGGKPTFSSQFISGGGGYGGCEDPRVTKIDDRIYMTYVAFDGCNPPRVALTSIKVDDFNKKNWHWEKSVLISKPGIVDKNACILPEKINGKYVVFHRVFPDILIDYEDDLKFDGKTRFLKGEHKISPRKNFWDSRKVGVGAPPIKTKYGWLLIYQAVGNQDASRYKIGAMLLDLNDPTKVLYRCKKPVLEPNQRYENEGWKYGVVYPCGAVNHNENLFVYYGGADKVICVAKSNLNKFIYDLTHGQKPRLESILIQQIRN